MTGTQVRARPTLFIDRNTGFMPKPAAVAGGTIATDRYAARTSEGAGETLAEIRASGDMFAFIGPAAPRDDSGSEFLEAGHVWRRIIPAGERVWLKRSGGQGRAGSVSTWPA